MHRRSFAQIESRRRRLAFTLIELLVVIMIIGILTALLMAGINSAVTTARVTAVVSEIENLEKAIADFKLEFGIEPPSFFVFFEESAHWADDDMTAQSDGHPSARRSREIIRKLWPEFLNTYNVHDVNNDGTPENIDLNGDGDTTDIHIFNGAECLVFFLGGVALDLSDLDGDGTADYVCYGFSANPANPFEVTVTGAGVVSSNRVQFYQFDSTKLVNTDNTVPADPDLDDLPEFCDAIPDQSRPYLYFSSYDGAGYRPLGADGILNSPPPGEGPDDETLLDSNGTLIGVGNIYYQVPPPAAPGDPPGVYWNPKTYQIISPGFDAEYGAGGFYNGDQATTPAERDNITNFKGSRLN
jgi:general secretion pathway protein G